MLLQGFGDVGKVIQLPNSGMLFNYLIGCVLSVLDEFVHSALFGDGEKLEAAKYLRIAAAYDPGVNAYLKECEEG